MYTVITLGNGHARMYKTARTLIAYLNTLGAKHPVIVTCPDGNVIEAPAAAVAYDLYLMEGGRS